MSATAARMHLGGAVGRPHLAIAGRPGGRSAGAPVLPAVLNRQDRRAQPNSAVVHYELRRPGVTLLLLREDRAVHPDGYGYSRMCGASNFPQF